MEWQLSTVKKCNCLGAFYFFLDEARCTRGLDPEFGSDPEQVFKMIGSTFRSGQNIKVRNASEVKICL